MLQENSSFCRDPLLRKAFWIALTLHTMGFLLFSVVSIKTFDSSVDQHVAVVADLSLPESSAVALVKRSPEALAILPARSHPPLLARLFSETQPRIPLAEPPKEWMTLPEIAPGELKPIPYPPLVRLHVSGPLSTQDLLTALSRLPSQLPPGEHRFRYRAQVDGPLGRIIDLIPLEVAASEDRVIEPLVRQLRFRKTEAQAIVIGEIEVLVIVGEMG